jgi:predicted TIM-barrel fold metal-dependent hydrolase
MTHPYAGPIIDCHHHLWDLSMDRHPWLAPASGGRDSLGNLAAIRRNYLPDDYRRDVAGFEIAATVHVEAGWRADDCLGETRWLETLDKTSGVAARYVVHVPLSDAGAPAIIEAQAAFARTVGVRDILSWDADPARQFADRDGMMDEPGWRDGLACLAGHGLSFDLMIMPRQHADAARLVADFPDQTFILNHCGSPIDRDEDGMRRWRDGIRELSRRPNLFIKISDLVAYDHDWTLDSLGAVVDHCIECFGTKRAMFASDAPVAGLHATIPEVWRSFIALTAAFSADEQRALFHDNARRIYRVDPPSSPGALAT